jgi:hypothetical protein
MCQQTNRANRRLSGYPHTNVTTFTVGHLAGAGNNLCSVIPVNHHDLSVTTEHECAAIESGATDASRPAGFIRACWLLLDGLRIALQEGNVAPRTPLRTRPSTDEPSTHPWHQISNRCCKGQALSGKRRNSAAVYPQGPLWIPAYVGMKDSGRGTTEPKWR